MDVPIGRFLCEETGHIDHGRDELWSAVVGETQPRVVVAVLDRDGVTRGEAIEVGRSRNPRWMRRFTRIVSTPGGALVAFEGEYRSVSTAPLRCEP